MRSPFIGIAVLGPFGPFGLFGLSGSAACGDGGTASSDAARDTVVADLDTDAPGTPDAPDVIDTIDAAEAADTSTADSSEADSAPAEVWDDSRAPFDGAGVVGGAIAGKVTVFVRDGLLRVPLEGATVRVTAGETILEGVSDAGGRVQLTGAELAGRVDLEVVAEGFGFRKLVGLQGAIAVVPLWDLDDPDGFATGRYTGTVDLSVLPPAPEGGVRTGVAFPLMSSIFAGLPLAFDRQREGSTWLERMTIADESGPLFERYTMTVYPDQALGVVIVGGTIAGDELGFPFTPTHVGFRAASAAVGVDTEVPEIAPDVPVDQIVTVRLDSAPYPTRLVSSWMKLPSGEVVIVAVASPTNAQSFEARTVEAKGPFAGARRLFWIASQNNTGTRSAGVLVRSDESEIAADDFLPEPSVTIEGPLVRTKLQEYIDVRHLLLSVDGRDLGAISIAGDRRGVNAETRLVPEELDAIYADAAERQLTVLDVYARGLDPTNTPPGRLGELTTKTAHIVMTLP